MNMMNHAMDILGCANKNGDCVVEGHSTYSIHCDTLADLMVIMTVGYGLPEEPELEESIRVIGNSLIALNQGIALV